MTLIELYIFFLFPRLDFARRLSKDFFRSKSSGNLNTTRRMSTDISMATGRFLDFHSAQSIGRRLSHGVGNSPPDVNSRRSSALTPRRESSPEPIQEVEPRKPNLLLPRGTSSSSLTPKNDLSPRSPTTRYCPAIPSRDIGSAAKKFSYVDVNSSSFKSKISKLHNNDTINSRQLSPCSPSNPQEETTNNTLNSEDCTLNRENWANVSGKSVEHIIEIIIPDDKPSKLELISTADKINNVPKTPKEKPKRTNLSSQVDLSCSLVKPTIVSYIPRKLDGECSNECSTLADQEQSKPESPLQKLSREELLSLIETPEQELKNSILEALKYKDPT